jgi:hypothetical protein
MVDQYKEHLFAIGRQDAQELLTFLARNYCVTLEKRAIDIWQLFTTYLVLQVRCMIRHAVLSDQAGAPQKACTANALVKAIAMCFYSKPWFLEELTLQQKRNTGAANYAWKFAEEYSLDRRANPTIEGMLHQFTDPS